MQVKNNVGYLSIYDEIGTEEGMLSAKQFKDELSEAVELGATSLIVDIHTPGGSILEGMAIIDALNQFDGHVTTRAINAISIGSAIALAGDEREIAANGRFMIHEAQGMGVGTAFEIRKSAELVDKMCGELADLYVEKTGIDRETIVTLMDEETWFNAQEAIDFGFATRIGSEVKLAASMDLTKFKNWKQFENEASPSIGDGNDGNDVTKKDGDRMSVATIKELKAKFPKASSDFLVAMVEDEKTMEEAAEEYTASMEEQLATAMEEIEELKAKLSAMDDEEEVTAMDDEEKEEPTAKVTARAKAVSGVGGTAGGTAQEQWRAKVDGFVAQGKTRPQAVKMAASRFPQLRAQLVKEANPNL